MRITLMFAAMLGVAPAGCRNKSVPVTDTRSSEPSEEEIQAAHSDYRRVVSVRDGLKATTDDLERLQPQQGPKRREQNKKDIEEAREAILAMNEDLLAMERKYAKAWTARGYKLQ